MPGIVIHDKKLVYWPIPKCACTTMKTYFARHLGFKEPNVHASPFQWTNQPIPDYFNFALVRNPYDRIASLYKSWDHNHQKHVYARFGNAFKMGMPFDEFVDVIISITDPDPHFDLQSNQVPEGVTIIKMEECLFLKLWHRLNTTKPKELYTEETKEKVRNHYLPSFIRFNYAT